MAHLPYTLSISTADMKMQAQPEAASQITCLAAGTCWDRYGAELTTKVNSILDKRNLSFVQIKANSNDVARSPGTAPTTI